MPANPGFDCSTQAACDSAELDAWRRDELAKGVQLAAWLRGNVVAGGAGGW